MTTEAAHEDAGSEALTKQDFEALAQFRSGSATTCVSARRRCAAMG